MQDADGMIRRENAIRRAAGIEQQNAVPRLIHRLMRMAEHNRVHAFEFLRHAVSEAVRRAAAVYQANGITPCAVTVVLTGKRR